jgi:hypothetical protein
MELCIHGRYTANQGIIPADVTVSEHPYTGEPFSHWYILTKDSKVMAPVYFGTGGYYPNIAKQKIEDFFR